MDWIEEARSYLARCYSGVIEPPASLIKRGVEEVRAIRKETVDLKSRISTQEDLISSYVSDVWKSTDKIARLEKEKAGLEERLNRQAKTISEYIDERKEWEKEKAELQDINRYINFQFSKLRDERFPIGPPRETETLRDKVASDFANITVYYEWHKFGRCKVADVCEMAYEFADAMMEARKK